MSWLAPETLARLGGLSHAEFLRDYWQQKPLFVKKAVPELAGLLDGDDLAGLSLEEDVESRLVILHEDGRRNGGWELRRGPFTEAAFRKLPRRQWTLLVQAVDHYLPELAELLDRFHFLPQWRIDDIMVSYAVDGGGVGPHYDSYDVFLIQGAGRRRWKVGPPCDDSDLLPHPDLRILRDMPVTQEFVCEPGDLLYLPPRMAHWGTAEGGDCLTWSVGFRMPSDRELLDGLCNELLERLPEQQRHGDPGLALPAHPGCVDRATQEALRGRLLELLDERTVGAFLGRFLSEPKYDSHAPLPAETPWTAGALREALAAQAGVQRHEASRFLVVEADDALWVDGARHPLGSEPVRRLALALADRRRLPASTLAAALADPACAALLLALFDAGHLYFPEQS